MPLSLSHEHGDTFRMDVSGVLRKADLDRLQELLLHEMQRLGTVTARLLVVLQGFDGWESNTAWNDLSFYFAHGDALTRIAIVGEERWRSEALMFAAADLRRGPVEFFVSTELVTVCLMRIARLSISNGVSDASAYGLAGYGAVLAGAFGKCHDAHAFGQLALGLNQRFVARRILAAAQDRAS